MFRAQADIYFYLCILQVVAFVWTLDGKSRNGKSYLKEFSLREELHKAATGGGLDVVFPSRVCKKMRQYKSLCDVRVVRAREFLFYNLENIIHITLNSKRISRRVSQ